MILHGNIIQNTEEWFEVKWGKIGGSSASRLMLKTKEIQDSEFFFEILAQHTNKFEHDEGFQTKAMEHGHEYEPVARQELSDYLGIQFKELGFVEFSDYSGLSPDGVNHDLTVACEIKCPSGKVFEKYLIENESQPPSEYLWQIVNYFNLESLETLYFAIYNPYHKYKQLHVIEITRDFQIFVGQENTTNLQKIKSLQFTNKLGDASVADVLQMIGIRGTNNEYYKRLEALGNTCFKSLNEDQLDDLDVLADTKGNGATFKKFFEKYEALQKINMFRSIEDLRGEYNKKLKELQQLIESRIEELEF